MYIGKEWPGVKREIKGVWDMGSPVKTGCQEEKVITNYQRELTIGFGNVGVPVILTKNYFGLNG